MAFRPGADGVYSRSHARAASSISGGWSVLPPLRVKETLELHLRFVASPSLPAVLRSLMQTRGLSKMRQGLSDASKVEAVIETLATNKAVQANTLKSALCQGVILFSALIIQPLLGRLVPADYSSKQTQGGAVYVLFHIFWLYPLALASIVYAGLLKTPDLTPDRRSHTGNRNDYRGLTAALIGESYKAFVLLNYLLFVFLLRRIPFLGAPISFLYACIVDSYYCYESQWIKLNWPFEERVKHLDSRWAYFVGFGFPITLLSWWSSDPVVNLALFSLFFPLFRIMSTSSIAQPIDPKLPTSSMALSFLPQSANGASFSMAAAEGGEEARGRQGHPMVPVRIPVLVLADKAHKLLVGNFATTVRKKDAGPSHASNHHHHHHQYQQQQPHYPGPAQPYQNPYGAPPADAGGWRGDLGGSGGVSSTSMYGAGVGGGMMAGGGVGGGGGGGGGGGSAASTMPPPGAPPPQHVAGPREPIANGYGYGQPMAVAATSVASGTAAGPSTLIQTPPRRGHVQTESAIGVGAEFVDRNLDSLISHRQKGD